MLAAHGPTKEEGEQKRMLHNATRALRCARSIHLVRRSPGRSVCGTRVAGFEERAGESASSHVPPGDAVVVRRDAGPAGAPLEPRAAPPAGRGPASGAFRDVTRREFWGSDGGAGRTLVESRGRTPAGAFDGDDAPGDDVASLSGEIASIPRRRASGRIGRSARRALLDGHLQVRRAFSAASCQSVVAVPSISRPDRVPTISFPARRRDPVRDKIEKKIRSPGSH